MTQHEPLPLVGLTEIAQRAGVQKAAVPVWRRRHADFPEPVCELRTGAVFWWPDVREWLERTGRTWDADLSVEDVNRYEKRSNVKLRELNGGRS